MANIERRLGSAEAGSAASAASPAPAAPVRTAPGGSPAASPRPEYGVFDRAEDAVAAAAEAQEAFLRQCRLQDRERILRAIREERSEERRVGTECRARGRRDERRTRSRPTRRTGGEGRQ